MPKDTRASTGYPTWYSAAARPLSTITTAERALAKSTTSRASRTEAPRAMSEEPTDQVDTAQDSLHLV